MIRETGIGQMRFLEEHGVLDVELSPEAREELEAYLATPGIGPAERDLARILGDAAGILPRVKTSS